MSTEDGQSYAYTSQQHPSASTSLASNAARAPVSVNTSSAAGAGPSSSSSNNHSSHPGTPTSARSRASTATPSAGQMASTSTRARGTLGTAGRPPHHRQALSAIRAFLRRESCFDILPESFRLIVFDNKLLIKRALVAMQTNGVVSAPLYDSSNYRFAGMFTLVDIIHLIQYYYLSKTTYDSAAVEVESVDLSMLRDIEVAIDVPPPPIISVHPDDQLYTACAALIRTHARRLPLIDRDDQTGKETIVSVLTQYRVLKFIAINCREECSRLTESIGTLGIGTYLSSFSPTGEPVPPRQTSNAGQSRRHRARSFVPTPRTSAPQTSAAVAGGHPEEGLPLDPEEALAPKRTSQPQPATSSQAADPPPEGQNDDVVTQPSGQSLPSLTAASTPTTAGEEEEEEDRFHPIRTATLQTTVFEVVHIFSELGISAVPIVDRETGQVINLYEAVDVVDLVRSNAYQVLDLTIEDALSRRSKDFPGVVTCTPEDSLASILAYIREKRAHRFVIVESDDNGSGVQMADGADESSRPRKVPGRLVGVLCLSDILKYIVGSSSLTGMRVVGLGFRSEEEGLPMPRVVNDEELEEINEGVSGLGIQSEP